ncbi:hypothetical protein [Flavobacterium sp.]|jgi:biopolymer transport protein ExbD|uniref:hypothetical protein n=1 Tax=Flavobacterium sp. TaxID=239 RepID=UPI002A826BB5|nr:hypothetical protein [Flavobacterium sp.]
MKKISITLAVFLLIVSCKKEDVQLPKADVSVIKELTDHSPIYMFYKNDSVVDVNKNNSISTTNWVFNIDKRLSIGVVIPEVMLLQHKKANSSHKKEGAINVFSYADSIGKNLAFLPFTDVQYKMNKEFSKFFIKKNAEAYMPYHNFTINFNKENKITVDGNDIEREELIHFINDFADFMSEGKTTILHLNFDKRLSYGQYIQNKILIWRLNSDRIQISSYEFIYDENELPECNCKL